MKAIWIRALIIISLCFVFFQANSQDIKVSGSFLTDSTRVGDEVFYSLSARYPSDMQVVFPDSAFKYSPFEYITKKYFKTETKNKISVDSAVYRLRTFEIDSLLMMRLPVFKVSALDSVLYYSQWDTIRIQQFVKAIPEQITADLPVRATIAYQKVSKEINYPVILVVSSLVLLFGAVMWFIFGDQLSRFYRLKRMKLAHQNFMSAYTQHVRILEGGFSQTNAESAISLWKKYMEQLNGHPYTKLTSLETARLEKDQELAKNLRNVDAAIYGTNTQVVESLIQLQGYADQRFNKKIWEVNHEQ